MDNSYIYFWRIVMLSLAFSLVAMSSNMGFKETALITLLGIVGSTLTTLFIQRKSQLNKINEHLAKITEKLGDEDVRSISKQIGLEGNYEPLGLQIKDVKKKQSDNKKFLSDEHQQILSLQKDEKNSIDYIGRIVEAEARARRDNEYKRNQRYENMDKSQQKFMEMLRYMSDLMAMYEREVDRNIALTNDIEKIQQELENLKIEYETTVHMCNDLNEENARLRQIVSNMKQQMDKKPRHDIEPLQP